MKIHQKKPVEEFKQFINSIRKDHCVATLYDTDMDGLTSGVLVKKGLEQLGIKPKILIPRLHGQTEIDDKLFEKIKRCTHLICTDLPLESYNGTKKLDMNVLVIDHHPTEKEIPKNFTVIKPKMLDPECDPAQRCAANLVYTLFSEITDMKRHDWLATIGMIADSTYRTEHKFIDDVISRYEEPKKDVFETDFSRAAAYGSYAGCTDDKNAEQKIFEALDKSTDHKEVIEKLKEYQIVENAIDQAIEEFEQKKEQNGDLTIYKIESPYKINSIVSTILSFKKTHGQSLLVAQDVEDETRISARRQDQKKDMGKLLKYSVEGLEGARGGGHRPAAGASIKKKDYTKFIRRAEEWSRK